MTETIDNLSELKAELMDRYEIIVGAFDISKSAKIVINSKGVIVLVNQQIELMFGYPRVQLIGQSVEMLLPERLRDVHAKHRVGFWKRPRSRPMGDFKSPLIGRKKSGDELEVQIELSPFITNTDMYTEAVVAFADTAPRVGGDNGDG